MLDLKFNHAELDTAKAMGIKLADLKRFTIDVEEYMQENKFQQHTHALEFVWASDKSFEMKILMTFTLGAAAANDMQNPMAVMKLAMKDLPPDVQEMLKKIMRGEL